MLNTFRQVLGLHEKEGLVLTLHNPFRSRDVSHFEKFREFHEKLYYYVEPISITPFSHKSVEKYLPLFIGAYVRHLYPTLADNKSAGNIDMVKIGKLKRKLRNILLGVWRGQQNSRALNVNC